MYHRLCDAEAFEMTPRERHDWPYILVGFGLVVFLMIMGLSLGWV
jgi:hypothetical protein